MSIKLYLMVESSSLRLDPEEILRLGDQDTIVLNFTLTLPETIIEQPAKSYVHSLHENSRKRRVFL